MTLRKIPKDFQDYNSSTWEFEGNQIRPEDFETEHYLDFLIRTTKLIKNNPKLIWFLTSSSLTNTIIEQAQTQMAKRFWED